MTMSWLCLSLSEPVIIRVSDLKDEILFPSKRGCSFFGKFLAQLEMSYLFTPEFINVVEEFQKHSGLDVTIHTHMLCVVFLFCMYVILVRQ